jgi:hypothetical protein
MESDRSETLYSHPGGIIDPCPVCLSDSPVLTRFEAYLLELFHRAADHKTGVPIT